jgi:hypothetical protein
MQVRAENKSVEHNIPSSISERDITYLLAFQNRLSESKGLLLC